MRLSVLVPVYNEVATVEALVKRVLDVDYPCDAEGSLSTTAAWTARVRSSRGSATRV